jgi:PPOX class probable F420-dependent enzyme
MCVIPWSVVNQCVQAFFQKTRPAERAQVTMRRSTQTPENRMGRKKLKKANYLSLATFRKSGVAVETPVWFAEEDDKFYIFSAGNAGKIKRLKNSPRCHIAACTMNGRITGDRVEAQSRVLTAADDIDTALAALRRKYGWQMAITNVMSQLSGKMGQRAYIVVTPE